MARIAIDIPIALIKFPNLAVEGFCNNLRPNINKRTVKRYKIKTPFKSLKILKDEI